ncbi:glycosyltransferase [Sulfuriferula sp.]|uniref:glycosyltransferase family 2 protein n=1 Tax=Sulfuriferula sp. TaxID=2025307 RepID=UPI0027307BB2|nr:glycosyltransferase [Sulfuriferula sp.]MDP2025292.1 glycosyltransferase [Sulfuriferula sp.]
MTARIAIIMPCYNCAAHLATSIGSVLAQTYTDWELIVVDDGSTDTSAAQVATLDDPRIQLIRQANAGVSAARNRALQAANSELVAFLDADDIWAPTFLEAMLKALDAQPAAALAYCGWQNIGLPGGRSAPFVPPDYETPHKLETLLGGCRWPIHATLTRHAAITAAGGFNPRYSHAEDFALWLQIATQTPIVRVADVLAYYHFHGGAQASANHARAALQLWQAQHDYIAAHPALAQRLGRDTLARLTHGAVLERAYVSYWTRDLVTARSLFRHVMRHGYGNARDWKYMLPALLPLRWHQTLLCLSFNDKNKLPLKK